MLKDTLIAITIAFLINGITFKLFKDLQWPKWKAYGKFFVYVILSGLGVYFIGGIWYLYIIGQPLLGLLLHIYWCKRFGLNWMSPDKEKYIESEKAYVEFLKEKKERLKRKS